MVVNFVVQSVGKDFTKGVATFVENEIRRKKGRMFKVRFRRTFSAKKDGRQVTPGISKWPLFACQPKSGIFFFKIFQNFSNRG